MPVIEPGHTFASVTDKISAVVLTGKTPLGWYFGFAIGFAAACMLLLVLAAYLFIKGHLTSWGVNIPVGWGFDIINFVWWIGIGHAGTLISAILLLFRQELAHVDQPLRRGDDALRRRVRAACYPAHPHRPAVARATGCCRTRTRWSIWPQFRSPLIWDVFAVSTYAHGVAAVLVRRPDPRPGDAARSLARNGRRASSTACSPWAGAARRRTGTATRPPTCCSPALSTPLVLSVHTHRQLRLRGRA
mgnify:CR=1 FL=1